MQSDKVKVVVYRWAGEWGVFKIKIPCGECSLTKDVILDTFQNELRGIPVQLETKEWLNHWWKPLKNGGWHAPIVIVEGKLVSQGEALNRGLLAQAVIESYAKKNPIQDSRIYGKETCPHCKRAKKYLETANIDCTYFDVVRNSTALYEMLARVKPMIGSKTPVTVPQIWIDGNYIGGADHLQRVLKMEIEPNPERGQCSLSPIKNVDH